MSNVNPQHSKDIEVVNRVLTNLMPYLFYEQEMTSFVTQRTQSQVNEIKDYSLKCVAQSNLYFSMGKVSDGIDYAEEALIYLNSDWLTWRQYMQCMFWRCGPVSAREVARRAMVEVTSPVIARDGMFYAMHSGDFVFMKELYDFLVRTEKLDDFLKVDDGELAKNNIEYSLQNYTISSNSGKSQVIKELSELMFKQLPIKRQLDTCNRLIDVSDSNDDTSLIYELHINSLPSEICAKLNLEFISKRVSAGLTDWDVGCMFVGKQMEE